MTSAPSSSSPGDLSRRPDVPTLLEELSSRSKTFTAGGAEIARKELLTTARSLCLALETPIEAILRMEWAEPTLHAANRVAVELKLFDKLAEEEGSAKSSGQLAKMTGADPLLMSRILKHLAAMGMIHEAGADSYTPTPLSNALILPHYRDAIPNSFDTVGPSLLSLPKYLASTSYANPSNSTDGPFQLGHNSPLHCFAWLAEHPANMAYFNNFMKGYSMGRPRWIDPGCFPVEELIGAGSRRDEDSVLLVDVGGGTGRDISGFKQEFPHLPGRLILQEQAPVIEEVKKTGNLPQGVEAMAHDFFTPQPIKGARAYFLHSILHDWPDEKCREILGHIAEAMEVGYSKLLVNDNVIPEKGAHWVSTGLDLFMMAIYAGKERTEEEWRRVIEGVGGEGEGGMKLKVTRVWTGEMGVEGVVVAERVR